MNNKQQFGQFYTTNSQYIVSDLMDIFPKNSTIVDPCAGNWDLLNLVKTNNIEAYDIDPKNKKTVQLDSLQNPPKYTNKWVLTNPPYLSKNKTKDKLVYNTLGVDDLYKAALKSIKGCEGGVIIIPLNFLSSRDDKIRVDFLSEYKIIKLKIFEEQVFDDTSYTVCAFSFIKSKNNRQKVNTTFYPSNKKMEFNINKNNGFLFGAAFQKMLNKHSNFNIKLGRLQKDKEVDGYITDMFLYAVDTGTNEGRIKLELKDKPFYGKVSDRAFATIVSSKKLSKDNQKIIIDKFNFILETYRKRYNSLFLTNFRNSTKNYARKRIEFETAYKLIKYIIAEFNIQT